MEDRARHPGTVASLLAQRLDTETGTVNDPPHSDQGLHPKAQKTLIETLRGLLTKNPGLQIVATSHSPYLLDHVRPEEVRLTSIDESGSSVWAALDEHPDWDSWKDQMTPGEFWSTFGDEWVARAKDD